MLLGLFAYCIVFVRVCNITHTYSISLSNTHSHTRMRTRTLVAGVIDANSTAPAFAACLNDIPVAASAQTVGGVR